jgi:adenosylmethionine-8-amino-7-oxononanoate aminotransferase
MKHLTTPQVSAIDQQHIWHPYSSMIGQIPTYHVARAEGVRLTLVDGRELIDGMASWWSVIHGYNHPTLNDALKQQIDCMSHVMFGGIIHEPAALLAKTLVDITPDGLEKVFFSDSGSVGVEVAIKMAIQYWHSLGQSKKSRLLSLRHGYHGDTFGAGAGGMRFYSPHYLKRVRELCDQHDVLLIADEIATGFGRSGKLFACEWADISPDILCVGKALTGGYMTLAATLCSEKVSHGICSGEAGVFMHGPTFMANPLACAAANASIELLLASNWQSRIPEIEQQLEGGLAPARSFDNVADVRTLGAMGVIEMKQAVDVAEAQKQFVEKGVWVRPFGKLMYVMPPYVISDEDIAVLTKAMVEVAHALA